MSDIKPVIKLAAVLSLTLLLQACAAAVVAGGRSSRRLRPPIAAPWARKLMTTVLSSKLNGHWKQTRP